MSDLRQLLGYESVSAEYDVVTDFEYQPVKVNLGDLQIKALANRPDLRAAAAGRDRGGQPVPIAKGEWQARRHRFGELLALNGISGASALVSIPLAINNRNQGEIARSRFAITQAQEQQNAANGQVLTDVKDAYEGLLSNDKVVQLYISKYLDVATQSRDISEYAYRRGGLALLDFLDAERSYRATELAYRQTLASYLLALEQLREAVGTRTLP